jgi:dipeptidyl aminopeptidase/acylaminoacyl peptidase
MMKAIDVASDNYPQIDTERLGVAGGSYGGIMTNWIIGHTDRFKAAVSQRSLCNMVSSFGTADNGFNFVAEQMASTPWENMDLLWHQSPLKYANKVQTPTLFVHSEEDYRCHYSESLQMFTALKYHGIDSRVCLIKGESHGLSRNGRPRSRIKRLEEITNWLDRYLMQS